MSQRNTFAVAAGLTALLVMIVAALAFNLANAQQAATDAQAQQAVQADQAASMPADPMSDPTVRALLNEREAAYKAALGEANNRLQEANARLQQMSDQIKTLSAQVQSQNQAGASAASAAAQPPAATPTPQPAQDQQAAQGPALSADQAALIAAYAAPGVSVQAVPTLVNFQGAIAYQVVTDGGRIYVDANSGQVLYSEVASASPAQGREHEGNEQNDDH